ncbi:MAG: hypothetical protein ACJA2S_004479 [Cyclobacteriaceae bacterium]|jgi:hypothetical protein
MEFKLKGGVLIIGSLYWQDHRDDAGIDTIRKDWRTQELMMTSAIDVKLPIKYGRFSRDKIYTMIFDNQLLETHFGVGKAVPFSNKIFRDFNQIKEKVGTLSNVEGRHDSTFIKGQNDISKAWCVCGIMFNPNIEKSVKSYLLDKWERELRVNNAGYEKFIGDTEKYSLSKQGELLIHWPKNATEFDFLIATSTQP